MPISQPAADHFAIDVASFTCPAPLKPAERIVLGHGSGGRLSAELLHEVFLPLFSNPVLDRLDDQAIFDIGGTRVAFTTDSVVGKPLFFAGGNIGSLAGVQNSERSGDGRRETSVPGHRACLGRVGSGADATGAGDASFAARPGDRAAARLESLAGHSPFTARCGTQLDSRLCFLSL